MSQPRSLVFASLVAGVLIVVAAPLPAHAQGEFQRNFNAAIRLYQSLEYERALTQIELARKQPHGSDEEVKLSLYEGIIQAELGHQDESTAAFKSALLVQPEAKLPVKVAPKVSTLFESVREQAKRELAALPSKPLQPSPEVAATPATPSPTVSAPAADVSGKSAGPTLLRRHALIPAIAGGALVVAGGVSWAVSRGELNRLRTDDPDIQSQEAVQDSVSKGNTFQTLGVTLLGVGTAGLAAAAGIYFVGASDNEVAVGLSTDGKSAFVYGRWP
jgi:hypothetical protein